MSFRVKAHTDARRRKRVFNVGRVLVHNTPFLIHTRRVGGGNSTSVKCLFSTTPSHTDKRRRRRGFNVGQVLVLNNPLSYRRAEEEEQGIQRRSSACSQ